MISNPTIIETPAPGRVLVQNGVVSSPEGERLLAEKQAEAAMVHPAVLPPDPDVQGVPAHLHRSAKRKETLESRAAAMRQNDGKISKRKPTRQKALHGAGTAQEDAGVQTAGPAHARVIVKPAALQEMRDRQGPEHWRRVIADMEIKRIDLDHEAVRIKQEIKELDTAITVARRLATSGTDRPIPD